MKILRFYCVMMLFVFVSFWISGCKTTGYVVRVEADFINSSIIPEIDTMLLKKGYELKFKERKRCEGASPNDVNTLFIKKFGDSDKKDWVRYLLYVDLFYVKDVSNNIAHHLDVHIYNHHVALLVPEIKTEIDNIGDLLYEDIASKVGKEKVKIERKEWGPPVIY